MFNLRIERYKSDAPKKLLSDHYAMLSLTIVYINPEVCLVFRQHCGNVELFKEI